MKRKNKQENIEEMLPLEDSTGNSFFEHIESHLHIYIAIFLLFLFVFSLSSLFGLAGSLGGKYFSFITNYLGAFAYPLPLVYLFLAATTITKKVANLLSLKTLTLSILTSTLFVLLGYLNLSGVLGSFISETMSSSFGSIPSVFFLVLIFIIALAKIFETPLEEIFLNKFSATKNLKKIEEFAQENAEELESQTVSAIKSEKRFFGGIFAKLFSSKKEIPVMHELPLSTDSEMIDEDEYIEVEEVLEDQTIDTDVRSQMYKAVSVDMPEPERERKVVKKLVKKEKPADTIETKKENQEKIKQASDEYRRPPVDLYTSDSGKSSAGDNKENARVIKRTLADFGISVEMDEVTVGPTVTRYALKPAQGVKIEKIINLGNNIALELGVSSVSITRIPERSLIGIEVPNKQKSKLGLANLLEKREFLERKDKLTMTLGKDIYGDPVYVDMARMPHMLVAGTTGSGKSVLVHALINSLVFKNSPYDLKFILIDPKKVEFALYGALPHLYTPIIKDPKKAIQTLNWLVQEMDRRYQILEEFGKQNIGSYHEFVKQKYEKALARGGDVREKLPEKMPYIVLVIDELADFMMKYPKEMESGIVKLAQMSRAVGIHLILATQRPSTNIITGVIKGNIPSRVALRVASQVDSRVIIDQGGAEKLLGYGDMLFVNSDGSDMKRIQSPFVSEDEIKNVVAYLRETYDDIVTEELKTANGAIVGAQNLSSGEGNGPVSDENFAEEDEKYEDAKQVVLQTKKTSISNLQVRLGTGYARSAKLINMLEQAGVIVTVNDPSGKPVKVVSGSQGNTQNEAKSQDLEKQADKLLDEENSNSEDEEKKDTGGGSFFKF
jgi:S-DNA-T family DNA segregation ATPase FtsK/SpoIIIE